MSQEFIRSELDKRLLILANAESIPVAFEDVAFDKQEESKFFEAFLLPAPTINPSVSGTHKRMVGVYQVNVWVKLGGELGGPGTKDRLVTKVVNHFCVIPKWSVVSIDQTPSTSAGVKQDGWSITPVTIQYRLETL